MMVTATIDIPSRRIADIMVTAFEGNYMTRSWVAAVRLRSPTEDEIRERTGNSNWYDTPALWDGDFTFDLWEISDESLYSGAFDPEGDADADLEEIGLTKRTITRADLESGIQSMATGKYRSHFTDWMDENEDAITADILLQLVALKDVVYG